MVSKSSSAARDLSVQIFDKFYIHLLANNTNMEEQYPSLPIIAASSFLLGSKMDTVHLKLKLVLRIYSTTFYANIFSDDVCVLSGKFWSVS